MTPTNMSYKISDFQRHVAWRILRVRAWVPIIAHINMYVANVVSLGSGMSMLAIHNTILDPTCQNI